MRRLALETALALLLGLSTQSFAASAETDAFTANVDLNTLFLVKSSGLAADHSESTALRAFADREAEAGNGVLANLDRREAPAVAQAVPVTVASNEVMTGRSAALDTSSPTQAFSAPVGTGALLPAAAITLDHLAASKGQAFDTLYKAVQINALRQLAGLYNAYSMTGDDLALRQMARQQLATTNDAIAELARF